MHVELRTSEPRTIAAVHARMPFGQVAQHFMRYLNQVYDAAKSGAVQLDGQNVFLYKFDPNRPDELDVAFGVGIREPFENIDNVVATVVPGGEVATVAHIGSYTGLRNAHNAVIDWCRAHNRRQTGISWEVYGHWTDDESKLRTDIFYLLEPE